MILLFTFYFNFLYASDLTDKLHSFAGEQFRIIEVAKISGIPWGFDFLSDNKMIITTQSGKVFIKNLNTNTLNQIHKFAGVKRHGQGGLMDVKAHPNFASNKLVFFSYILEYGSGVGTVISKAKLQKNKLDNQIIFRSNPPGTGGRHFGSRIVLRNNKVFFGIGDRGDRKHAQKLNSHLGKILRINEDGSIPSDNPHASAIWSIGHRNPQGLYYDNARSILWEQEHGPRGGDEINQITKAKNYGWPVITYGKEYWGPKIGTTHRAGMEQPVKYFIPSIAPSSLLVYSGKMFKNWEGDLFSAALRFDHINKLKLSNKNKVTSESRFSVEGRIRHLEEKPDTGEIYFSMDSGYIYKIVKNENLR